MTEVVASTSSAESVLVEIMNRMLSGIDATVEFSQQHIPDILEQLLLWRFYESVLSCILSVFLITVIVTLTAKKFIPVWKVEHGKDWLKRSDFIFALAPIMIVISLVISLLFMSITWVKIWLAPKLFLLEYGATLVK